MTRATVTLSVSRCRARVLMGDTQTPALQTLINSLKLINTAKSRSCGPPPLLPPSSRPQLGSALFSSHLFHNAEKCLLLFFPALLWGISATTRVL